jgi:methylmalonyl-CoA mutase N-terminal domain/subunit
VEKALSDLKIAAAGTENLMPYILVAVEAYASLGEVADVMRSVFGEY